MYELLDGLPGAERTAKLSVADDLRAAVGKIRSRDYDGALRDFEAILRRAPEDRVSRTMAERMERILREKRGR